jgi:hypothetical protein
VIHRRHILSAARCRAVRRGGLRSRGTCPLRRVGKKHAGDPDGPAAEETTDAGPRPEPLPLVASPRSWFAQDIALSEIYDPDGLVSGWTEADRLYSAPGTMIGWLRAGAVYSLAGNHVGWLDRGQFRDNRGCVVAWTPSALGGPRKPVASRASRPVTLGTAPAHPSFSRRMSRIPFSSSWSSDSWESFLR